MGGTAKPDTKLRGRKPRRDERFSKKTWKKIYGEKVKQGGESSLRMLEEGP